MTSKFFHCFSYIDNILLSATIKSLYLFTIKVSVRGKFAILQNFTFLSGWINLKVIF